MKNKIIIPLILIILSSFSAFALTFPYPGYNNNIGGISYFDTANVVEESSKATSDPGFMPLIEDLNNDSINEIIILDDANVEIYQGTTLTPVDAIAFSADPHYAYIYDIDGDSSNEIIVITTDNTSIIGFNGTSLSFENSFAIGFPEASIAVGCRGTNDCAIAYGAYATGAYARSSIYLIVLNSTAYQTNITAGSSYEISERHSGSSSSYRYIFCPSSIPYLQIANIDNVGTSEYVASFFFDSSFSASDVGIYAFSYNSTGVINKMSYSYAADVYDNSMTTISTCTGEDYILPRAISSPLVYDFDGFPSNGLETVFAYMKDDNEFKMKMISGSGVLLDTYPSVLDADGVIVSNPVLMNAFSDTGAEDFCIMGYASNINEIDLLCGSAQTSGIESKEFNYAVNFSNIALGTQYYIDYIQSVDRISNYNDGNDLSDLMTPYGIFYIDYDLDNELIPLYLTSHLNASHVSVDINNDGRDDIIELGQNGLVYWSDGFTDHQVAISKITQNPASPICTNTTLTFQGFLIDDENDAGNCTYDYYYINNTLKEQHNVSFSHGQSSVIQQMTNNVSGIYYLTLTCQDDTSVEDPVSLTVNNVMVIDSNTAGTNCYDWNEKVVDVTPEPDPIEVNETIDNTELQDDARGFFCETFDLCGPYARNIIAIILSFLIGLIVYIKTDKSMPMALSGKLCASMVLYYLGLMSILPLIIIVLVVAYLLVRDLMKGTPG